MHLVLLVPLCFNVLESQCVLTGNRQIIHISGNDDLNAVLSPHPDTMIRGTARETERNKGGVQLLIPLPRTLL